MRCYYTWSKQILRNMGLPSLSLVMSLLEDELPCAEAWELQKHQSSETPDQTLAWFLTTPTNPLTSCLDKLKAAQRIYSAFQIAPEDRALTFLWAFIQNKTKQKLLAITNLSCVFMRCICVFYSPECLFAESKGNSFEGWPLGSVGDGRLTLIRPVSRHPWPNRIDIDQYSHRLFVILHFPDSVCLWSYHSPFKPSSLCFANWVELSSFWLLL